MTRHQSFAPSTGAFIVVPEENEKSEPFSNRKQVRIFLVWWARVDSNHRSWKAADLQSVPIGHSGTRPYPICSHRWLPVYFIIWSGICQLLFPRIFSFSVVLYFPAFYRNKSTFYNSKRPQNVFRFEVFLELVTGVEPATHWLQISCAAIAPHQQRLPK